MALSPEIFSLARHNRIPLLQKHLDSPGCNINATDEFGNSLLIIASQNGHKNLAKLLIKQGADINFQNVRLDSKKLKCLTCSALPHSQMLQRRGNTAPHYCYLYNHPEVGDCLLMAGANYSIRNSSGLQAKE